MTCRVLIKHNMDQYDKNVLVNLYTNGVKEQFNKYLLKPGEEVEVYVYPEREVKISETTETEIDKCA